MRTRRLALLGSLALLSTAGCGWAFHLNQNPHVPARTPQILRLKKNESTYIRVLDSGVLSASPNLQISCALPALTQSCKVATGVSNLLVVKRGALVTVMAKAEDNQPRVASLCLHDEPWVIPIVGKTDYAQLSSGTCGDPLKLVDIYIAPKDAESTTPSISTSG